VFGSVDNWNGLGIFFDSFDNDGLHNNPYISVVLNDGSKSYDHDTCVASQLLRGPTLTVKLRKSPGNFSQ